LRPAASQARLRRFAGGQSFATQPNALVLAWPTNFSEFSLQQNSDPGPTNWVNATNAVSVVGTNYQATNATISGTRFFRLRHP